MNSNTIDCVVTKLPHDALIAQAIAVVLDDSPRKPTAAANVSDMFRMAVDMLRKTYDTNNKNGAVWFSDEVEFIAILTSKLQEMQAHISIVPRFRGQVIRIQVVGRPRVVSTRVCTSDNVRAPFA